MGYRSQVRSLIYGDPDKLQALVTKHMLEGGMAFADKSGLRRYRMTRKVYTATDDHDGRAYEWVDHEVEVLDLYGDDWKWYPDYPDVQEWERLLADAPEFDLSTEFVRIGEETEDIEQSSHIADDGDSYLGISRQIADDLPAEVTEIEDVTGGEKSHG